MSALQGLRQRRETVKSTQKMMSAMKMVSASKLKQLTATFSHIQAQQVRLNEIAVPLTFEPDMLPAYTHKTSKRPALWLVLGANRGLCGHFHTQLLRSLKEHISTEKVAPLLYVFGERAASQIKSRGYAIYKRAPMFKTPNPQELRQLFNDVTALYTQKEVGSIAVLSTHFQNALVQTVRLTSLYDLFSPLLDTRGRANRARELCVEPTRGTFNTHFFETYGMFAFYRLFTESILSEEGCRMTAMDSASRNSDDILNEIELMYNRQRQAMITKELIEVVSGAQALC